MPSQLKQRVPWLSFCEDVFFTAYDPPTALKSITAFVPVITPGSDPRIQAVAAVPSPTIDPGARKTATAEMPIIEPIAEKTPPSQTHLDLDPKESSSDPKGGSEGIQSSDMSGDPGQQIHPSLLGSLQPTATINSNLNLEVPGLPLHPTVRSVDNQNLHVPGQPFQSPSTIKDNQRPKQNASPIAQNEPDSTNIESPAGDDSGTGATSASQMSNPESTPPADTLKDPSPASRLSVQPPQRILTTIAGHAITAAPTAIAIAGTRINPGDPGVTIGGTPVALDKSGRLILGTKAVPLPSGIPQKITTTIAGQAVTADSAAVAMKGTTLRPGGPIVRLDGTPVALDTNGQFLVGLRTIPFTTASAKPLITTIAGQLITAAATAIGIPGTVLKPGDTGFPINGTVVSLDLAGHFVVGSTTHTFESESASLGGSTVAAVGVGGSLTTIMPSAAQNNASIGTHNSTSTNVQVFAGEAGGSKWSLLCLKMVAVMIAMITLLHAV